MVLWYKKPVPSELEGHLERITYTDSDSGFTIAKVQLANGRDLVTVVGNLPALVPGQTLEMKGEWVNHPRYGKQFQVSAFTSQAPSTLYGVQKYLGSGLVRGIGPVMAERIVDRFGEETLKVIENQINRLSEVPGIGHKRIQMIQKAWAEQHEIRELILFLQSHGIGPGHATRIFKQYGTDSLQVIQGNPYRLAVDVFGIGFQTADSMARRLGFLKDSPVRAEAGVLYVLHRLTDEGNVCYPYEPYLTKCQEILEVNREAVTVALATAVHEEKIIIEDVNEESEEFRINQKVVYLSTLHLCEVGISRRLKTLSSAPKNTRKIDADRALQWVQSQLKMTLAERQILAVKSAIQDKVLIITGGPGTGKTTIIKAILEIFDRLRVKTLLAAPTGRAAKRMTEATGRPAKTIHRMLEFSLQRGGFQKNDKHPLHCDLLIVDEASMIDTFLMYHLLKAVPNPTTFILVGDINQLPSVGPGTVLKDILSSGTVGVAHLTEIFRQAQESSIVINAHRINDGILPRLKQSDQQLDDFYFIEQEDPEEVLKLLLGLIRDRIPRRFGLDPVDDIQLLTPMHKGLVGAENLNRELQEALNPGPDGVIRGGRGFRVRDKVMQITNNYEKGVFNGDIGRVRNIDSDTQQVTVSMDGREVEYEYGDLDELVLAYAISVHKSQGSEYPAVIIPLLTQHYVLLQRNLIYTAVTRGKRLVVLVGSTKALSIGIKNNRAQKRYSRLQSRLR